MTRSEGGKKGAQIRWGGKRPPTKQIRITEETAKRLREKIPEAERLGFCESAIRAALNR